MPSRARRHVSPVSHRAVVAVLALLAVVTGSLAVQQPSDAPAGTARAAAGAPVATSLSSADAHDHADDHDGLRTVPSIQREIATLSTRIKSAKRALRRCDDAASRRSERACERRAVRQIRALKRERAHLREQLRRSRRPSTPVGGGSTAPGGGYSLLWSNYPDARWRCTSTLTYRVNTANAPASAVADVRAAFTLIGRANGYTYSYLGGTTATGASPTADIVVSWTRGQVDNGGGAIAVGGNRLTWSRQRATLGAGYVTVESSFRAAPGLGTEGSTGATLGRVLVHEIGHVMGLGHVQDPSQIMYGTIGYQKTAMNSGDRAGFVRQGRAAACA